MRVMTYVTWTSDEVTETVNNRYDQLLSVLVDDGVITEEQAAEIEQYRCVVAEKNIFGKIWEKLFDNNHDPKSWSYIIQKFSRSVD